jgi:spermidine/putrescine-binding protein
MGIALKSMGYSINSDSITETQAAGDFLLKIKQNSLVISGDEVTSAKQLASGELVMAVGWSADIIEGRTLNKEIKFVIPDEGTLLWGDNLVIHAKSPHQYAAELLLDFLMRPEINAQLVNGNGYATANEAARAFVKPELLNDSVLFPNTQKLKNAELIILPKKADVLKLRAKIWQQFLDTPAAVQ